MKFLFVLEPGAHSPPGGTKHFIVEARAAYDVEQWARCRYRNARYSIKLAICEESPASIVIPPVALSEREKSLEHAASILERARKEGYAEGYAQAIQDAKELFADGRGNNLIRRDLILNSLERLRK